MIFRNYFKGLFIEGNVSSILIAWLFTHKIYKYLKKKWYVQINAEHGLKGLYICTERMDCVGYITELLPCREHAGKCVFLVKDHFAETIGLPVYVSNTNVPFGPLV